MQYFIGSVIALLVFAVSLKIIADMYMKESVEQLFKIRYSQKHIHTLIRPLLPPMSEINNINNTPNQSKNHRKKTHVRVLIIDEKAYWKKDNVLYVADIYDNDIDRENAVRVDIMGMDKVELDKMLFIVDQLSEGADDDNRSTGNE
jgi:hypothetical protein